MTSAIVTIPEFAGTRWAAGQLVESAEPTGAEVILDFTGCRSAAQGFCDELVSQLADARGLRITEVRGASERSAEYIARALRLRGLSGILDT